MPPGETDVDPGAATPPILGWISTESAFVTAPQFKVAEPPGEIVRGDAVNEEMFGVPLQPVCGAGVRLGVTGVLVGVGDGTRGVAVRVGVAPAGVRVADGATSIWGVAVISFGCGATGDGATSCVQSGPTQTIAISENAEPVALNACAWML